MRHENHTFHAFHLIAMQFKIRLLKAIFLLKFRKILYVGHTI